MIVFPLIAMKVTLLKVFLTKQMSADTLKTTHFFREIWWLQYGPDIVKKQEPSRTYLSVYYKIRTSNVIRICAD